MSLLCLLYVVRGDEDGLALIAGQAQKMRPDAIKKEKKPLKIRNHTISFPTYYARKNTFEEV